jgi:hypothetical protein
VNIAWLTHDIHPNPVPGKSWIPGGCAFYRCFLPMRALGFRTMGFPAWTGQDGFGVRTGPDKARFGYDTVVLKLLMERQIPYQIKVSQSLGQRVIIDVDDFYEDIPVDNAAFKATSAGASKARNREYYNKSILLADTITVSTPFLHDYYSQRHPDVRLVRNGVILQQFPERVQQRKPIIGWVGAIPWKTSDVSILREWLPDFLEQHDLMFHHSGAIPRGPRFEDLTGVNPDRVTSSLMEPIDSYHDLFTFDIGLMPLIVNDFNRAKSCLKGLEYAAAGIPFVASALPEYQWLSDRGCGRVAASPEEWVTYLTGLLDLRVRKRETQRNKAVVLEDSMDQRAHDWLDVFQTKLRQSQTPQPALV